MSASATVFPRVKESKSNGGYLINDIKDLFVDYLVLINSMKVNSQKPEPSLLLKYSIDTDKLHRIESLLTAIHARSKQIQQRWKEFERSKLVDINVTLENLDESVRNIRQIKRKEPKSLYDAICEKYFTTFGASAKIQPTKTSKPKVMIVELAKYACRNTVAQLDKAFMPVFTNPSAMSSHPSSVAGFDILVAQAKLLHLFADINSMLKIPKDQHEREEFYENHLQRKIQAWDTDDLIKQDIINEFKQRFFALKPKLNKEEYDLFSNIIDKILNLLNEYFTIKRDGCKKRKDKPSEKATKLYELQNEVAALCRTYRSVLICHFRSKDLSSADKEYLELTLCLPDAEIVANKEEPSYQRPPLEIEIPIIKVDRVVKDAKEYLSSSDKKHVSPQRKAILSTRVIGALLDAATSARIHKRPHTDSGPSATVKKLRTASAIVAKDAEHKKQTASSTSQAVSGLSHSECVDTQWTFNQDPGDIVGFRLAQEIPLIAPVQPPTSPISSTSGDDDMMDQFNKDDFNFVMNYSDSDLMSIENVDDEYRSVFANKC